MKIVAISDTHGQHDHVIFKEKADVLVFAGDWTRGRDVDLQETDKFLKWLDKQPFEYKVIIAGNHEMQVEADPIGFRELLKTYNITYLEDESVTIKGVKFYGSPYSNEFCNWAFMGSEEKLKDVYKNIPNDTNVLITHGPAYRCFDKVRHPYGGDNHVGSKVVRDRKASLKHLQLHICGHIHESGGCNKSGNVVSINASVLNASYDMVHDPYYVTLKETE